VRELTNSFNHLTRSMFNEGQVLFYFFIQGESITLGSHTHVHVHSLHSSSSVLFTAALSSFFTHESPSPTTTTATTNNNNNLISSLYRVYIAYVHLVHAIFSIPMHAHTAPISSTSRVLCVIIIVTLQLLWLFSHAFNITGCYVEIPQPLWQLGLFVFSVTVELTFSVLVTGFHAHPSVNPF
jgi:hypothetical protein